MTAEEYVVERLLNTEKEVEHKEAQIKELLMLSEGETIKLKQCRDILHSLKKYISVNEYSVTISMKRYDKSHLQDIEALCNYLGIEFDHTEDAESEEKADE